MTSNKLIRELNPAMPGPWKLNLPAKHGEPAFMGEARPLRAELG